MIFSGVADQHSTLGAKAQERNPPLRVAYFASWNAQSSWRGGAPVAALGMTAHDGLASADNSQQRAAPKAAAGSGYIK
jgi:hypothetical protein